VKIGVVETSLNFEPPAFENAAGYLTSETIVQCCDDRLMSWPSLVKLGSRTPEKALSVSDPTPKIFYHTVGDTQQMFEVKGQRLRSRVKGQRSRSQRKVMYQQQKCYNTAMDRFSDFKLAIGMAS